MHAANVAADNIGTAGISGKAVNWIEMCGCVLY